MREKILAALREAGHGLTPLVLTKLMGLSETDYGHKLAQVVVLEFCVDMESDKLLILHRADGSAATTKGEIVLVTLRPKGH